MEDYRDTYESDLYIITGKLFNVIKVVGGGSLILFLLLIYQQEKNKVNLTFNQTLNSVNNDTLLDEYLNKKPLLEQVEKLEQYMSVLERLNKEITDESTITNQQLKETNLLEPIEIEQLLADYCVMSNYDEKLAKELLSNLKVQQNLINNYIITKGTKITADLLNYTLKIKIAETYGLSDELTFQIANDLVFPSTLDEYDDKNGISMGVYRIKLSDKGLENMLKNMYEMYKIYNLEEIQSKINTKDLNKTISNSLNIAKRALPEVYKIEDQYNFSKSKVRSRKIN